MLGMGYEPQTVITPILCSRAPHTSPRKALSKVPHTLGTGHHTAAPASFSPSIAHRSLGLASDQCKVWPGEGPELQSRGELRFYLPAMPCHKSDIRNVSKTISKLFLPGDNSTFRDRGNLILTVKSEPNPKFL